jgi:integrase
VCSRFVSESRACSPPTMNGAVAALRFFFTTTCNRPEMARHLRLVKQPQKLPVVVTTDEVLRLLEAAPGPKYKAALVVAYGAGLRVSEVANLKVSDIDSERRVLRVEQGMRAMRLNLDILNFAFTSLVDGQLRPERSQLLAACRSSAEQSGKYELSA